MRLPKVARTIADVMDDAAVFAMTVVIGWDIDAFTFVAEECIHGAWAKSQSERPKVRDAKV